MMQASQRISSSSVSQKQQHRKQQPQQQLHHHHHHHRHQHIQLMEQRNQRRSSSSNIIIRLISSLDLRFTDPKVESSYHIYYAQVKRNLLPTAIQVVLLVNLLQFLTTCFNFYLLADVNHQLHAGDDGATTSTDKVSPPIPNSQNFIMIEKYARTLILPILLQTIVFIAIFSMLRIVSSELNSGHSSKATQSNESLSSTRGNRGSASSANKQKKREKTKQSNYQDHRSANSSSSDESDRQSDDLLRDHSRQKVPKKNNNDEYIIKKSSSQTEQISIGKQRSRSASLNWTKYLTSKSLHNDHSGVSGGLSASLSLAIGMPIENEGCSSSCEDDHYNNNDEICTGKIQDRVAAMQSAPAVAYDGNDEVVKLAISKSANYNDCGSKTIESTRKSNKGITRFRGNNGARRFSDASGTSQVTNLNRCKLALPYFLWLCQVVQLISGSWPQQSFITYSTLLLYSYAIYVIFPIRLHSCILLALSLNLIEPIFDYSLLLYLRSTFGSRAVSHTNSKLDQFKGSILLGANLTSSDLRIISRQNVSTPQLLRDGIEYIKPTNAIDSLLDNKLAIPMTSQLSKLWAFMILTLGINIIGIMSYFFYERQQRAAFLETRQSLETKLILEQESREQERLLLSILPKHLASEIRQDLGAVVTGQFKKIYMSRHENVSILFADIVGFTAISSHCPAPELVKILNELFARFDKLAEKYHQLRIKILGDCYYAISGAPEERPDHAVLCVHMGLSMVEAVKSVRERTKSPVDMRVGVHTGGVLAGVLGQRQWQFDVYSKDVELANKMESSGLPGRVHISNATLRFLNDEFEVSEGDGAAREEALRLANIKTYFIDRVKKPYPEGTLDAVKFQQQANDKGVGGLVDGANRNCNMTSKLPQVAVNEQQRHQSNPSTVEDSRTQTTTTTTTTATTKSTSTTNVEKRKQKQHEQQQQQRNDSFNLDKQIKQFSLNFSNRTFERQFRSTSDIASCISLIGLPITLLCAFLAYICLYKVRLEVILVYACDTSLLLLAVLICFLPYLWHRRWTVSRRTTTCSASSAADELNALASNADNNSHHESQQGRHSCVLNLLIGISEFVGRSAWMKLALSALMALIWLSAHFITCKLTVEQLKTNQLLDGVKDAEATTSTYYFPNNFTSNNLNDDSVRYQEKYNNFINHHSSPSSLFSIDLLNYYSITCALAITAISRISFLVKTIIILTVILHQVILNKTILDDILVLRSTNYIINVSNTSNNNFMLSFSSTGKKLWPQPLSLDNDHINGGSININDVQSLTRGLASFDQYVFALTLITICWALYLMNRQFELTNRRLFLWRKQVEERKEKVADMRRKNEALVYNILPPNVAKIFLGKRQINDEALYSKSYDAVGVLFAAMPNFSDFYTEESVNNQGLECLRFLNEVISDYDALLDQARFKNIIKIKTMGPTYMAASGLYEGDALTDNSGAAAASVTNVDGSGNQTDLISSKWGHLEQLTEFALALKDTLANINKESFNNFVLRIGINQGPITAGVIGVKKPHFDMWGNTVNVASRMESTGRAGSIQVVEETATILRHFGFEFDQRGLVSVKGKGKLMTFYLTGRGKPSSGAPLNSSAVSTASPVQSKRVPLASNMPKSSEVASAQNGAVTLTSQTTGASNGANAANFASSVDPQLPVQVSAESHRVPSIDHGGRNLPSSGSALIRPQIGQTQQQPQACSNENGSGSTTGPMTTVAASAAATTTTMATTTADISDRRIFITKKSESRADSNGGDIDLV